MSNIFTIQNQPYLKRLAVITFILLLVLLPRLTSLNQYLIVDEADRWRWAKDFVTALNQGDLPGTLIGDGYPGIVPVWAETISIFIEAGRRSLLQGEWIGEAGFYNIFHEWDRSSFLFQQRLPIVLLNTVLALLIIWAVWRLLGGKVALVSGLLIALDPFYLSDTRVNRAEAVITGLMTLSMLALVFYYQKRQLRYIIISGIFGGLSFLTKIQALSILPFIALVGFLIYLVPEGDNKTGKTITPATFFSIIKFGLIWAIAACLVWFILWPSMWVIPVETLTLVYNYTTRKVGAEGIKLFFWGQTYQDADPGLFFYPVVFLMRITPLALIGLIGVTALRKIGKGGLIIVLYILLYLLIMSAGSHKQDRYLMPIFLSLDILGAMGLVYIWEWFKSREYLLINPYLLFTALLFIQLLTVFPHHPYYYSYFNPLFGGGKTATQILRIGWGEGMDKVGEYLAAKEDSKNLVVSSRFRHNMLYFKGEIIPLGQRGSWTKSDYVVLYIQQTQRRLDPSPAFLDYFQARKAEKIITIGGIDYAWIYPIPFTISANPQITVIPDRAVLFGYSWEKPSLSAPYQIRLLWKNLGLAEKQQLKARLTGSGGVTEWVTCNPSPSFTAQAQKQGAYVESLCLPDISTLPPNIYNVEFGLSNIAGKVKPFIFPEGWLAAQITAGGNVVDTADIERLDAVINKVVPHQAKRLDRIYNGSVRLAAYLLEPATPRTGDNLNITLYWQPVKKLMGPVNLTVQLADSRKISLGRSDSILYRPPLMADASNEWKYGEIITTSHNFALPPEIDGLLATQLEIKLTDEAELFLPITTMAGENLDPIIARFAIEPKTLPDLAGVVPTQAVWQNSIALTGYKISPEQGKPGDELKVTLFWKTAQPIPQNYTVFIHLLDSTTGQLKSQTDSLPLAGAYPTKWWQPRQLIEDTHSLTLPNIGSYQLLVGLYNAKSGIRLLLSDGRDSFNLGLVEVR